MVRGRAPGLILSPAGVVEAPDPSAVGSNREVRPPRGEMTRGRTGHPWYIRRDPAMPRYAPMLLILFAVLFPSCSSANQQDGPPLTINVRHVGGMPPMRAGVTVPIYFEVDVTNHSSEPVTLERLQLASVGGASYQIGSRTELFRETIPPAETRTVNVPASARVLSARTSGDEPITIRATVHFDAPSGAFRRIVIERLGSGLGFPR
jgi:hypothetical protein